MDGVFIKRSFVEHPIHHEIRMTPMVTIPISPLVCSVLTTLTLIVTFYAGRYVGIRWMMDRIYEEMEKSE